MQHPPLHAAIPHQHPPHPPGSPHPLSLSHQHPPRLPPCFKTGFMTDGSGVPTGTPLTDPPLIAMISEDPLLRGTKLIAEAWDCDGLNQVGVVAQGSSRMSRVVWRGGEWCGEEGNRGGIRCMCMC
jgi:hypothetical protein